jgi:electron transfer flavoprotein beta subunit
VTEIVAISVGTQQSQERLRTAMAMGADRGILVEVAGEVQPLALAKLVKAIVDKEQPKLVIMGKQAIDDDSNQAGQMTAALLDWPQSAFTSAIAVNGDTADVTREIDGGLKKLTIKLPAVVPCSLQAIPIKSREVRQFMENDGHEEEQIPMYSCSYMKYARRAHPSFIFCLA